MKNVLSHTEIAKLLFWAETEGSENWGGWSNYPLSRCTYTSIEDCHIFIKFDYPQVYTNETFTHIVSGRGYLKEGRISLSTLKQIYNESQDTLFSEMKTAAVLEFEKSKEAAIKKGQQYREDVSSGKMDISFKESIDADIKNIISRAVNKSFSSGRVGEVITAKGDIYLGSAATAVYSAEICAFLRTIEDKVKDTDFQYEIYGKSGTGKTKYAKMIDSSMSILLKIVDKVTLEEKIFSAKIEQGEKYKSQYE